ncbi:MAG: tyrosine-type recombinase/integrase [Thermoproteota archaeon]
MSIEKSSKKVEQLLKYNTVKEFYKSFFYVSRSDATKEKNLYALERFCKVVGKNPDEIVKECKEKGKEYATKLLRDFLFHLSEKGASPKTQDTYLHAIKSFFNANFIETNKVNRPRSYTMTIDRAPTKDEIRNAIIASSIEGRALISFLAVTGCRIGEALKVEKNDLELENRRVKIRPEIAKDRVGRYVFLTPTAVSYLKAYLESRRDNDNRVFPFSKLKAWRLVMRGFRSSTSVVKEHGRYALHPHSLRKFFFSVALLKLGREIAEIIMGHKRYLDASYLRVTVDVVQKEYEKIVPDLEEAIKV